VIDFGVGSATKHIADWLRSVGFTVEYSPFGSTHDRQQIFGSCAFVAARCMADLFIAGSDWFAVNLDHAVEESVIHEVSATLVTHGIRREPVTLPLTGPGAISPSEACAAAALLAGERPGDVSRLAQTTVGHLPQDVIAHIAAAMKRVSSGGPSISDAAPEIQFAQGNVRVLSSTTIECHAVVVAFSIELL
jgi:hypothetical protein